MEHNYKLTTRATQYRCKYIYEFNSKGLREFHNMFPHYCGLLIHTNFRGFTIKYENAKKSSVKVFSRVTKHGNRHYFVVYDSFL